MDSVYNIYNCVVDISSSCIKNDKGERDRERHRERKRGKKEILQIKYIFLARPRTIASALPAAVVELGALYYYKHAVVIRYTGILFISY